MTTATTSMEKVINAINESIRHNVSVELLWDRPMADLVNAAMAHGWDVDYTDTGDPGVYDVWGWDDQTPENEQAWRLTVRQV